QDMEHSQMAKRTRVPPRRGPNRKKARQEHKNAHQAQPPIQVMRRSPASWRGVPIEYTPELLENARYRFEETDESLTSIPAELGVHRNTLRLLVLRKGWKRYVAPRDLSTAAKLLVQAERLQSGKQAPCAQFPENNERPAPGDAESAPTRTEP